MSIEPPDLSDDVLDPLLEEIESQHSTITELRDLINKIYDGNCNLETASIIAANYIPALKAKE